MDKLTWQQAKRCDINMPCYWWLHQLLPASSTVFTGHNSPSSSAHCSTADNTVLQSLTASQVESTRCTHHGTSSWPPITTPICPPPCLVNRWQETAGLEILSAEMLSTLPDNTTCCQWCSNMHKYQILQIKIQTLKNKAWKFKPLFLCTLIYTSTTS